MDNLKRKLCNFLIENEMVEENDVIRHSYSTNRMNHFRKQSSNNNISPTLDTRCDCLGITVKGENMNSLRIRKLTPRETWRLMGFDDSDYEKVKDINSKAQLYRQAGNSIVVNVLVEILRELLKNEEKGVREI